MRHSLLKTFGLLAVAGLFSAQSIAQDKDGDDVNKKETDEIVIIKKGDKDTKLTVEMKNGDIKVNGKPLSEFKDDNVSIQRRKNVRSMNRAYTVAPRSQFRGGAWNFDGNENADIQRRFSTADANRAFLGVASGKDEKGAKVTSVTKESAAEKAGMKEGDIITKVDDSKIEGPEDLTKAITKHKPDEKVDIAYLRDSKEMKATITLGKRNAMTYFPENFDLKNDFNFDMLRPNGPDGPGVFLRGPAPRLGIKAQDTEDGKGVKVLSVDKESNAEKAGIKDGDLITDFDGKAVNSATELSAAAREAKDKTNIKLKLNRAGKSQDVEIKIPKKLKTASL